MHSYKKIDTSTWNRKLNYEYFKTFSNPCYGFDVEMDIDNLYKITKETKTSFFINMTFILTKALNSIEEMRLRIVNGEVLLYDMIDPTYVIMTKEGYFENGGNEMSDDYHTFYDRAHKEIEAHKNLEANTTTTFNPDSYDKFYMTCIPWIKYESMIHPIPDKSIESQSVPRTCFGKYYQKDGRMKILLNITVSHVLCDGYPLSKAFMKVQEMLDNASEYLK